MSGKEVAEFELRTVSQYRTDPTANFLERGLTAGRNSALSRVKTESAGTNGDSEKPPPDVLPVSQIACRERLGGVQKHYYRKAA